MSRTTSQPIPVPSGKMVPGGKSNKPDDKTPVVKTRRQDGMRETIESVVIAFILAFLFRTFEAEAFVIPTGSMAPTLLGRHKDVVCHQCGYEYRVGASFEVNDSDYLLGRMRTAACPNCRYVMPEEIVKNLPVFKGDRILVNKFPFEFQDPERWNVVVFKYPEHPETNYIKRLIGLPGETIEIRRGDVYRLHDGELELLRKEDPNKQKELQILVYDNNYPEMTLHAQGWPKRWAPVKEQESPQSIAGWTDDESGWQELPDAHAFHLDADNAVDGEFRWLRYRHFVPEDSDWQDAAKGKSPHPARAELITDFCGYNAATGEGANPGDDGYYWVGDLTLNTQVEITSVNEDGESELLLELNEGGRKYRCRVDLKTGVATLFFIQPGLNDEERSPSVDETPATAETALKGTGKHTVSFANVDDRLCLWVDGKLVKFNTDTAYTPDELSPLPQQADLIPVGIAARGAGLKVSQLLLERDIYYRGDYYKPEGAIVGQGFHDGRPTIRECDGSEDDLQRLRFNPEEWAQLYSESVKWRQTADEKIYRFELGPDEFFMMGDNSPSSLDSRLWAKTNRPEEEHRYAVSRKALVGKAFYVYWPHGVPFLNDGRGYPLDLPLLNRYSYHQRFQDGAIDKTYPSFTVPFYPQVDRMRRIR